MDKKTNSFVAAVCWERLDSTTMVWNQITGGAGSTSYPNYFYYMHAAGDRDTCQVACEQQSECYAYSLHSPDHGNGYADMCYGISESRAVRSGSSQVNSGRKVDCGNQTGNIM